MVIYTKATENQPLAKALFAVTDYAENPIKFYDHDPSHYERDLYPLGWVKTSKDMLIMTASEYFPNITRASEGQLKSIIHDIQEDNGDLHIPESQSNRAFQTLLQYRNLRNPNERAIL